MSLPNEYLALIFTGLRMREEFKLGWSNITDK